MNISFPLPCKPQQIRKLFLGITMMTARLFSESPEPYRVALLFEPDLGGRDRVEFISRELRKNGFELSVGNAADLADPTRFTTENFGALILPNAPVFPVEITENLLRFLEQGGDLVLLGGTAFETPLGKTGSRYVPARDAVNAATEAAPRKQLLPGQLISTPGLWRNQTDSAPRMSAITPDPARSEQAFRIDIRGLSHFDTFKTDLPLSMEPGTNVLCFSARAGSEHTAQLAVELVNRDRSRWIATVDLNPEWTFTALRATDFVLHERQGASPIPPEFDFTQAEKISFGLTKDYTRTRGRDHRIWIDDVSAGQIGMQNESLLQQLPIFTDLPPFQISSAPEATVHPDASWLDPVRIPGPHSGTAAFAVPFAGTSQIFPILQVPGDPAPLILTSVLAHYDGAFAGSQWLLSGSDRPEFYQEPGFIQVLTRTLKRMQSGAFLEEARASNPLNTDLRGVLGVTHVDGRYHFSDQDFLNEGVDVLTELGTRTIKLWMGDVANKYPFNSEWPEVASLTELAATPYFSQAFRAPFDVYYLEAFSLKVNWEGYKFRTGVSPENAGVIEQEFYEVTKHFLTEYQGTGKTFVLQNWEGDWALRPKLDPGLTPTPESIQGMIDWLNARQNGINRARAEVGEEGVRVLHAAEMNLVMESMKGRPGVVNSVIPHTQVDLLSYSCYETQRDPKAFRAALEYMQMNAPPSEHVKGNRVVIGEFGVAENVLGEATSRKLIPQVIEIATAFGCPHLLYWELYCNEPVREPVEGNQDVRGYWLIKPDGSKAWVWDYFQGLLKP